MVANSYHPVSDSSVGSPASQSNHRRTPSSNNSVHSMPADGSTASSGNGRDNTQHVYQKPSHHPPPPSYPPFPPTHQRGTSHSAPATPNCNNTHYQQQQHTSSADGRQMSSRATLQHSRPHVGAYSAEPSVAVSTHSPTTSMPAPQQPLQYNSGGSPHGYGRRSSVGASGTGSSTPASFRGFDSSPTPHTTYHQPPTNSSFVNQLQREIGRFPATEWRSSFVDWERLNHQLEKLVEEHQRTTSRSSEQYHNGNNTSMPRFVPSICPGAASPPRTALERLDDTYWAILKSEVDRVNTFYQQKQLDCLTQFNDLQISYHFGPNVDSVNRFDGTATVTGANDQSGLHANDSVSPSLPARDESHSSNASSTNPSPRPGDRSKAAPPNGHHLRSYSDIALSLRGGQSPVEQYNPHTPVGGGLTRSFDHAHISTPHSYPVTYPRSIAHKRSSSHMSHSPVQRRPANDPAEFLPPSCPYITSLTFCKLLYQAQPDLARSLLHENILQESERLSYEVMNPTYVMLFNRFLTVCSQLDWLRKYITLNYIVIMKALQQYDQSLQQRATEVYCHNYLYSEQFYTSSPLAILLGRAEGITQWVIPMRRSIERSSTICMLCQSEYTKPVILNCNHRFCFTCLTHNSEFVHSVKCPKCSVEHPIDVRLLHVDSVLSRYVGISIADKAQPLQSYTSSPVGEVSAQHNAVEHNHYYQMPHAGPASLPYDSPPAQPHQHPVHHPQPATHHTDSSRVPQSSQYVPPEASNDRVQANSGMHADHQPMVQEPSPASAKRAKHEQQQRQRQQQSAEPHVDPSHRHHQRHVSEGSYMSSQPAEQMQAHQPTLHVDTDSESQSSQFNMPRTFKQSLTPKHDSAAPLGPAPPPIIDRGASMPASLHRQHSMAESAAVTPTANNQPSPKSATDSAQASGDGSGSDVRVGFSCHRCKCTKENEQLIHCTLKSKGGRRRECKKKFCKSCLTRIVGPAEAAMAPVGHVAYSEWVCPACCGTCKCAACKRKYMWDANKQQQQAAKQAAATPTAAAKQAAAASQPAAVTDPVPASSDVNGNNAGLSAAPYSALQPPSYATVAVAHAQAQPTPMLPSYQAAGEVQPHAQPMGSYAVPTMQPPIAYSPQYQFAVPRQPGAVDPYQATAEYKPPLPAARVASDTTSHLSRLSPTMLDTLKSSLESSLSNYVNSSAGGAALIGGAALPPKAQAPYDTQSYPDHASNSTQRQSTPSQYEQDYHSQPQPSASPQSHPSIPYSHYQPPNTARHMSDAAAMSAGVDQSPRTHQRLQSYAPQQPYQQSVAHRGSADEHINQQPAPQQHTRPAHKPSYADQAAAMNYSPSVSAAPHQRAAPSTASSYSSFQSPRLPAPQIANSQRLFSINSLSDQIQRGGQQMSNKHSAEHMDYSHDSASVASRGGEQLKWGASNPANSSSRGPGTPAPNYVTYGSGDMQHAGLMNHMMMDDPSLDHDSCMGLRPTAFNGLVTATPGMAFGAEAGYFD